MAKRKRNRAPAQALPSPALSFVRLFHPFPSFIVAGVTVAFALFAHGEGGGARVLELGLGMLSYQFAIGIANDLVDAADDRVAKPWKAIPRGVVSRRHAVVLAAGLAGCGLAITAGLPFAAWLVGLAGLACGLGYDVQLKRTPLSWLPLAVALPLIPTWVALAVDRWEPLLGWAFPLGIILGFSLHLANQAPDIAAEPALRGAAHRLGSGRSARVAVGLFGLAALVAVIVLVFAGAGVQAGVVAATSVLAGTMAPRATRLFGRDGLFGLLAASSGALGVAFLSAAW